jgi:predicted metal-dependent phosphoesterase TrpH
MRDKSTKQKEHKEHLVTEFHCHTVYSRDSLTLPKKLVEACRRKHIDKVVVTDHNTIEGALRCKELSPETVIVGEEILTQKGELLAAFVTQRVPPGLSPMETVSRLREQNAFISAAHPFDRYRSGCWTEAALLEILPYIDAVETFNARCLLPRFNRRARDFAAEHGVPGTFGSDAHAAFELGRGLLRLPYFDDAQSLKLALKNAEAFKAVAATPLVRLVSRRAVWWKKWTGMHDGE